MGDKMNYVYMVQCADGTLYTGWTTDIEKRLQAHNDKKGAKYTRNRTPVKLYYCEECSDKSTALKREAEIKKLPRSKKLDMKNR